MAMTGAMAHSGRADARPLFADAGWPLVVFIWAAFSLATGATALSGVVDKLSTDDAMRLVEVRDLLAGQSWFDLVQHRLNPPDGVLMHWSRVVDLPIALMLVGSSAIFGESLALQLTVTVWPALLFLAALLAAASASRTLAGPGAGVVGAFLMVTSPGVATRYAPGAIDHHGAQIALALVLLACILRIDRSTRAAVGAGLAAALMAAIGMETAPHLAVAAGMVALRWAATGDDGVAKGAGLFGLSFAGFTVALAAVALGPQAAFAAVCDAFGFAHIVVAVLGGVGLFLATRHARGGAPARFSALALLGVVLAAGLMLAAPNCLASPFSDMPERLKTGWLYNVQEAQDIFAATLASPTSSFAIGLPLVALAAVAAWALASARREDFWRVATAAAMCGVALAVTCWQIRGAGLAFALGGPLLPVAVAAAAREGGRLRGGLVLVALCPSVLALTGLALASAAGLPPIEAESQLGRTCSSQDYAALGRLPRGLALNTIDTGPFILAFTPHSAVAGPYHRNVDGLLAALDAFSGSEETARAIAVSRGAAYIVGCVADGGLRPAAEANPDSFAAGLMAGRPASWLEPVDLGPNAKLRAWRVLSGR